MVAFISGARKKEPDSTMKPERAESPDERGKEKQKRKGRIIGGKFYSAMAKGGRVGLKAGSKGCKLAMKGKGRAYGKNS